MSLPKNPGAFLTPPVETPSAPPGDVDYVVRVRTRGVEETVVVVPASGATAAVVVDYLSGPHSRVLWLYRAPHVRTNSLDPKEIN